MQITSFSFLIFLVLSIFAYYVICRRFQWQCLLTLSVIFFVMVCGWKVLILLAYGIGVAYIGSRLLSDAKTEKTKKIIYSLTILLMVGQLFVLKYINFFTTSANVIFDIFSIDLVFETISLLAPIGISYYMLSLISYVTDVYWESIVPEKNIGKIALFACYFPHMTSGPIISYTMMKDEFFKRHPFNERNIKHGCERILWGFIKKLVLADRLSPIVNTIYSQHDIYQGCYLFLATMLFAIQLYADFSGCMDIIMGASELFGIKLPENFDIPFTSETLPEFWRRWHITLGVWSKNYLFYPILKSELWQRIGRFVKKKIGKKRAKNIPTYLGLVVNWFLIGMWHGGSYKFIFASGLLPCTYLILGQMFESRIKQLTTLLRINTECYSYKLFRKIRTILIVCSCWVFIGAKNLTDGFAVYKDMFSTWNPWIFFDGSIQKLGLLNQEIILVLFSILMLLIVGCLKKNGYQIREELDKQNYVFQYFLLITGVFFVVIFGIYGPGYDPVAFIYGQF